MKNRGTRVVDVGAGDLPGDKVTLIEDFSKQAVGMADRLFWKVLSVTRRNTTTPALMNEIANLSQQQRAKMWRLANKWLPPPEMRLFLEHLKAPKEQDVGAVPLKIPFGKTRAFSELVRRELKDAL